MMPAHLYVLFLITFTSNFCHGISSINSFSSNFGYRSRPKGVVDPTVCSIKETCEPILKNTTCFGTQLPYSFTSVALADDSSNQFEVQDNLALLEGLRSVPRCWAVVQPLLCSLYMPKCENGSVSLPSQEMCRITRGPCSFVETIGWPSFLQCDNKTLFPPRCRNPLQEIKFNTTYKCIAPLVETDKPENWFHEVEGCGLQCQDPFFTKEEHEYHHHLTFYVCAIGWILAAFTMVTYVIDRKDWNHQDACVFYMNLCLVLMFIGWLIQFFSANNKTNIVCNDDGTIRRKHPRSGEHLCNFVFTLTYYSLMAHICWFVNLIYGLYMSLKKVPGDPRYLTKKKAYFHLFAWLLPVILTVAVAALNGVDGDSMNGICFVSYVNIYIRLIFFSGPIFIATVIALIFQGFRLHFMFTIGRRKSREYTNTKEKQVLRRDKCLNGVLTFAVIIFAIAIVGCTIYQFINEEHWSNNLKDYIVCLAMYSSQPYGELHGKKCALKSKPNILVPRIELGCLCLLSFISWMFVLNPKTMEAWKKLISRFTSADKNANKIFKHDLIAKAYQNRHQINQANSSVSWNGAHDGVNVDNSIASNDISLNFVHALPQFLTRRNAVPNVAPYLSRHFSSASDISHQISVDSFNQQTLDSLSMQISEQDFAHVLRQQRRKTKRERERYKKNRVTWLPNNRRDSDTSLQSSLMAYGQSIAAVLGAKVTKSTSTGDLGAQASVPRAAIGTPMIPLPAGTPMIPMPTGTPMMPMPTGTPMMPMPAGTSMMPMPAGTPMMPLLPNNRKTVQREEVIPPFMHGMDGTHGMDQRLDCRSIRSSLGSTVGQNFTPASFSNLMGGMIRPPMYGYDMMSVPFGYGMYPPMYPGYSAAEFNYATYGPMPYVTYGTQQSADALYQYQQSSLIPLQPRAESASETEYLPIVMSDSEYTDTGFRSYDEAYLSACLMHEERLHAQAIASAANSELAQQPKPMLEPQECAKTQFLKRLTLFSGAKPNAKDAGGSRPPSGKNGAISRPPSAKNGLMSRPPSAKNGPISRPPSGKNGPISRPPSGKKTPHSEAPPPSPADSLRSLEIGDDDVFEEEAMGGQQETQEEFLPQRDTNSPSSTKSSFKRATSLSQNCHMQPETLELCPKKNSSSLGQLPTKNSTPPKSVLKEKCLNAGETECLLSAKTDDKENISR